MKLVPFTCAGARISVNPQHVVTVREAAGEKNKTVIFLATGGQITVDCPVDEVTGKLCGQGL